MAVPVQKDWIDALFSEGTTPMGTKQPPDGSSINLEMLGAPASSGGFTVACDSNLFLKNGFENHTLTLVLKIHLNPVSLPWRMRQWPIWDGNDKVFMIQPWPPGEWAMFTQNFTRECLRWNDRFWLIPAAHVSKLDVKQGGRVSRPNVYCHLYVTVVNSPAGAHRSIDVVNLDLRDAKTRHGLKDADLDSGAFRSDAGRYDSLDVKTRPSWNQDDTGAWLATTFSTIGHALGLPHIGVTHKDPQCQTAILLKASDPAPWWVPAMWLGSSNSLACYGHRSISSGGANVMGGGSSFDESNAAPWARRLGMHTGTKPTDWSVFPDQGHAEVLVKSPRRLGGVSLQLRRRQALRPRLAVRRHVRRQFRKKVTPA